MRLPLTASPLIGQPSKPILDRDGLMCLFGVLEAEADSLSLGLPRPTGARGDDGELWITRHNPVKTARMTVV